MILRQNKQNSDSYKFTNPNEETNDIKTAHNVFLREEQLLKFDHYKRSVYAIIYFQIAFLIELFQLIRRIQSNDLLYNCN